MKFAKMVSVSIILTLLSIGASLAQDKGRISLELNQLSQLEGSCRPTFVITNGLQTDIDQLTYEFVFFDSAGLVINLIAFEFGALATGKTIVRQYAIKGMTCDQVSRVLLNNATQCTVGGKQQSVCVDDLTASTRTSIKFGL